MQTLLRLVTGDGVGDCVGEVMGLFSCVLLAWGREGTKEEVIGRDNGRDELNPTLSGEPSCPPST